MATVDQFDAQVGDSASLPDGLLAPFNRAGVLGAADVHVANAARPPGP